MATLIRRERHPVWVALAAGFTVAAAGTMWLGVRARADALAEGTEAAATATRTTVSPILASWPIDGPLAGRRARILRDELELALAGHATFATVRIFALDGRVLLDAPDPAIQPAADDVAPLVGDAADDGATGTLRDGVFAGYIRVGDRIVELTSSPGRFEPPGPWRVAAQVAILLVALSLAMSAITARQPATEIEHASLYRPAIPRRPAPVALAADVLPTISVFAAGDLEIRHDGAHDHGPVPVRDALTT